MNRKALAYHFSRPESAAVRFCVPVDGGSMPYRVEDLPQIESIEFAEGYILVARDRMGQLWRYAPVFGGNCVRTHPEKMFPGLAFSNTKPPISAVRTTRSTTGSAHILTDLQRVVRFTPYEVGNICGWHNEVCPLDDVGFTNVIDVANGPMHTLAVRADGTLWSTGSNDCGQAGTAYAVRGSVRPRIQPIDTLHHVIAVAAGERNSVALEHDGSVWQWGNMSAPLVGLFSGDGPSQAFPICHIGVTSDDLLEKKSSVAHNLPERVVHLPPVKAISSFWAFDLALARDGTVWGWGNNSCGQLGIDTRQWHDDDYYLGAPHRIDGLENIVAIAAGQRHALALGSNGEVWAWGVNGDHEIGQALPRQPQDQRHSHCVLHSIEPGEENFTAMPMRVPGIPHSTAIAAGEDISAAVDSNGNVWLWGQGHP